MSGRSTSGAAADAGPAILVVDDNTAKRLAIEAVLQPLGHQIICVESGEAALAQVMQRTFAVILMDVQMPEMDGYETARFIRMREQSEHTPIIFVTAHVRDEAQIPIAYSSGAVDFIFAPIVPDVLRAKVSIFVDLFSKSTALENSQRQTRQILETAHNAFVSIDADGLITAWNPQAEAHFGWSSHEVLGRELTATIVPEAHREAHLRGMEHFLATGEGHVLGKRLELTALHRDGREFPIELTISALQTEQGFSFNAFISDITERYRAQAELVLARDQALDASRMKSMFVANVSHEIRTPMNGVIGMTELLLDTDLDPEQREYVGMISSSGEALMEVIDDILDFSKIEAGKVELHPTDFDLREAIETACGTLAARAHAKDLELMVAIEPELPARVHGDAGRLRQVITNFVSNAVKFTAEGEVVVRASFAPANEGALVRLEVSDTGIGIEREALGRLFQPFSQADGSTTRKYGGTGLGLAISRQLIELMGGRVGAESEPGNGSCFWFEVTLARAEGSDDPPAEKREMAGLRVLVVDDNAINRKILQQQLSSWQMSCEVAGNATHALELLDSATRAGLPYALVLLDLNMPDVDGYQLARAIRSRPALRAMRLVLLTSSGSRSVVPEEAAVDGFLTKPVRQSQLYEEIQTVLAGDRRAAGRGQRPALVEAALPPRREARPAVLVAEDTPVNQMVAALMLEKCGFDAHVAENGREALRELSERSFAAVLMDCQMPELDGYETTREVRRLEQGGQRTPIIAMTANSMQGDRERCLAAGMDDYLTKPLRAHALKDALTHWITKPAVGSTPSGAELDTNGNPGAGGGGGELLDETLVAELEQLGGEVLSNAVRVYADQATGQLSELTIAIGRGETLTVAKVAHKLKGAGRTLGATQLANIASKLEATAKAGDLSAADELLDELRSGLDETMKALDGRVARPMNGGS